MSITILSKLTIIRIFIFSLLAITSHPTWAGNTDSENLSQQVEQALNSFIALYDEKINYDGQFPYDIAKHNKDIEKGYSQKNPENTDPNKVLEFKLSAAKQMFEYLQTLPVDEINEFRETLAGAAKRKQEYKEYELEKKRKAAEYREQQRIAKSLPTYDRDHFYQAEKEFLQHYNERINFDQQIPIAYFGYHETHQHQKIKDQLADAASDKEKKAVYHRAERDVIIFANRLYEMSAEDIAQFREGNIQLIKRNNMADEHKRLTAELDDMYANGDDADSSALFRKKLQRVREIEQQFKE